jgi:uncharacterized protein
MRTIERNMSAPFVTIGSAIDRRGRDVRDALTTMPGWRAWRACAILYVVFLLCAAPIGLASGVIRPGAAHLSAIELLTSGALIFIQPALVEEIVFRALLLPRDTSSIGRGRLLAVAAVALAVYVASHPINAMLFRPQLLPLFASPAYLLLTALLGATCTAAYFISRSIWPAVAIHWLTVVAWIWLLGGQRLLC